MKKVNECLLKYLEKNDTVVLAVSGGPDSMALLQTMLEFRRKIPITIICAHVNHKIRLESDSEAIYVKEFCLKNNVTFEYKELLEYKSERFSEADAREKRYTFFDDVVKKYNAKYLFTAHHGDDLIESILMRIVRGSTLKGYSGIAECSNRKNYKIIRPFLSETKESLIEYLNQKNIKYVVDSSNKDINYTRNRYRINILPYLKSENNLVHLKFLDFSKKLLETENYILDEIKKYDGIVYNKNEVFFSELIKLPFYLQKRIIMNLLYNFYEDNIYMITDKHINIIFSSLNKYNSIVILPNNILFNKNGDILFLSKKTDIHEYNFEFEDKASLPNGKFIEKIDASEYNTNYYCRLSNKDINFPLRIRTRKNGDKMTVKNMEGMKKINDIFTDMKIPKNLRDSWPILVDNNDNILWLPGLKKSKFDIEKDCNCDIILTYY